MTLFMTSFVSRDGLPERWLFHFNNINITFCMFMNGLVSDTNTPGILKKLNFG